MCSECVKNIAQATTASVHEHKINQYKWLFMKDEIYIYASTNLSNCIFYKQHNTYH